MFGTVLAMLNTSACRLAPRAATSRMLRTKPLSRDTIVPAAITALAESSELWVEGNLGPALPGRLGRDVVAHCSSTRHAVEPDPEHDAAHDHHGEQDAAGDDDVPDQPADLAGAQAEGERGAGVLALGGDRGQRHLVHARPRCCTRSRMVVRCAGLHARPVRVSATFTSELSRAGAQPDGDRLLEPVDERHRQRAGAAGEGDEVGAGDLHLVHLRAGVVVERAHLVGRQLRRRLGAVGRGLQRGAGQPVGHVVVVGEQVAEHGAGVHQRRGSPRRWSGPISSASWARP